MTRRHLGEWWGRADDGALARVVVEAVDVGDPVEPLADTPSWWPPIGLHRLDEVPASERDATITLRARADVPASLDRLESDLGLFTAERLDDLVAVHAAVIDIGDDRVVVPGPSMVGKSTLAAAALARGWVVASDEYALVAAASGAVRGWPRRIRLRSADGAVRLDAPHLSRALEPKSPALVAVLVHDAECAGLDVRAMSPGETVLEVLANTVCAASRPEFAFGGVVALAETTRAVVGRRGEADGALGALADLLASAG
ncbi:MAG: hypothetical protein ACKOA2_10375 [Ilumatobacteraceae bacterium]